MTTYTVDNLEKLVRTKLPHFQDKEIATCGVKTQNNRLIIWATETIGVAAHWTYLD